MQRQRSKYVVLEDSDGGYDPRGAARELWGCRNQEVILSGPAETGKTYACLQKLHALCIRYPGIQCAMVRKTRKSMTGSVLQTYERKVIRGGVRPYGGSHVEWYDYDNGSRIYVGGMDNPDKILSSERDVIYVNQAEELTLDDWEKLLTRATGRAGNMPYPQMLGDCNPWGPSHWILKRAQAGALKLLESRHEDNPTLFTSEGEMTEQGVRTMAVLDTLTGIRYQRLRRGKWVSAEGIIYDSWDRAVHVIDPIPLPDVWTRYRVIDFGYTNPFVCLWFAQDQDGRLYLYRELYQTGLLVEDAAKEINRLTGSENIRATICDHDAEDRATLERYGIPTIPAKKDVKMGIQAVQTRLRKAGDGKPRLYVLSDCLVEPDKKLLEAKQPTCLIEEMEEYVWETAREGTADKETPRKVSDHSEDCLRYLCLYLEKSADAPIRVSLR